MPAATVMLDGMTLTPEDVLAVARHQAPVTVSEAAVQRIERCRKVVTKLLTDESRPVVYGLTTGFGSLRDILISSDQVEQLQRNLLRSHSCGVGAPAPPDVVRAMMLLRANTLAKGYSGVRREVVETLVQMLNQRVYPLVPVQGSVGASGDLAPLSHLALVLMGEGEAFLPSGERVPGAQAMQAAGIPLLRLEAKEGLALNNGTQFMTAVGVLALLDAEYLTHVAALACALSLEAIKGVPNAFEERLHKARPHPGQQAVAQVIARQLEGSEILAFPVNTAHLNNARGYLKEAEKSLREAAELFAVESEGAQERCLGAAERTREILDTLAKKLASYPQALKAELSQRRRTQAESHYPEELRRVAKQCFDQEVVSTEGLHQLFSDEQWRHRVVKARKHLKAAWDELEQVVPDFVPVQDDYSFRCTPQVLGTALDTFRHVRQVLTIEMNAATDNPLIFPPERQGVEYEDLEAYAYSLGVDECKRAVVSGGNFHGEPVAVALDQACIALAEVGNISERRTFHLTSRHLSNGLPPFLIRDVGLQSGLMLAQYTAAALVSENKTLCHPASVDSIPTCEDAEDHVSMGAYAARKFADVVGNVTKILAIELICAAQGVDLREPARPSPPNQALLKAIRDVPCPRITEDRELGRDMERVTEALRSGRLGQQLAAGWAAHRR
jgi:histidine ammonia-lyase